MASGKWSVRHVLAVWSTLICASLVITAPGVGALRFLNDPKVILVAHFGYNFDFNCTTDDPNATVSLWYSPQFGPLTQRPLTPGKLILNGQVFTLINLVRSDGGMYACKATSESGQSIQWPSGMGRLLLSQNVLPKHFVLIPSKAIIVLQGKSGSVTCESEGVSVVTLKWEKETESGSYVDVPSGWVTEIKDTSTNMIRAVLKITNAQLADTGVYKCTVAIKNKSNYRLMRIRVDAPGPPSIEPYNGNTVIKEGQEKILRCVAKGSPKPDVAWYRDGKKLNTTDCKIDPKSCENILYEVYEQGDDSSLHTIYTDGVLKIRKALYPRDDGEFKCVASNGNSPSAELAFDLDVQVAPKIRHQINQQMAEEHQETKVFCVIEKGNPLPTFKWQYQPLDCTDGTTNCLPDESQWVAVPTSLMVTPTAIPTNKSIVKVKSDEANTFYRCQASNSLGNDSQVVRLVRLAKEKSMIEVDTKKTKTEFDERSTLSIYWIDRCNGFCVLVFSKDNKTFSVGDDPRFKITRERIPEQFDRVVLTIKNLTLNDSGDYRCALKIDPTEFANVSVVVKKLTSPNITGLHDKTVVQKRGVHVMLNCDVFGHPDPTITWYFDPSGKDEGEREIDIGVGLRGNTDNCDQRLSGYFYLNENVPDKIVICSADFEKHQGKYRCNARNTAGSMDKYALLTIQMAPLIIEPIKGYKPPFLKIGDTLNVTCKAKGNPPPNVSWTKNSTGMIVATSQTNSKQLVIKSMKEEDFGVYSCIASNKLESTVVSIEVEELAAPVARKDQGLSTGALVGIGTGVGVFVLILLVVCCVLYRRQKKQIDEYKQLYFLQQSDYKIDPDRSLLEQCNDLPYDPDWEFPEERLILGNILGAGAFGQVVRAEAIGILALNPRDKSAESFKRRSKIRRSSRAKDLKKEEGNGGWKNVKIPVAVKTLKEGATQAEYKDLASELKILIHLGQHKNIVNLLGACTRGKRLMVIMEFAPHGSLLSFLRGKRETYEANWTKTMNDPEKEFTLVDLVMIGFQVGRGMSFLASKKCVHRDLAARNILVGEDYVMKIADFGLARDIYKDDLYVKKTQGLLPVKWMAPESLFDRIYTEKTDVWSFGVLLWETFTLGGSPYPGLPTEQLLDYLSEGKRMDMPAKCPLEVYTIMRDCWIHEDEQRPHFTTLTERLAKILEKNTSKENPYLALQMEEEAEPSQGYYMQPCDDAGIRESKRYVKSPVQSPSSDSKEPPNFKDAANAEGDGIGYDSPLPTLPPGLPVMSDEDIPNEPLPPIPPSYENATRTDSAGRESGIDVDGADDGYVDDARVDSPFLPPPGNKPVALDIDSIRKTPEAKVFHGRKGRYETQL